MKRREFVTAIAGTATYAMLPGCDLTSAAKPAPIPGTGLALIDAHCHVFNASDLPVARFIEIVLAKHYPKQAVQTMDIDDPTVMTVLIALFTSIFVKARAPKAQREIDALDGQARREARNLAGAENRAAIVDAVAEFITDSRVGVSDDLPPDAVEHVRGGLLQAGGMNTIGVSAGEIGDAQAQAAASTAYESKTDIGAMLRWVALFTRYRHVLAETLAGDLQAEGFRPTLLTPALVDYDYWLGERVEGSPLPKQVEVMGRIARRRDGVAVHGLVGFDPLRQARRDAGIDAKFDSLGLVRDAITKEGFLGVKLYPPMGFRPIGNGRVAQAYPDTRSIRQLREAIGADGSIGQRLDDAMAKLFDLGVELGAGVLAHANNSNGAGPDYEDRADPGHWLEVFRRWPSLQVSLAHFGTFTASSVASPGVDMPDGSWEWALGKYVKDVPDAPVFADVSYLTEIAGLAPAALDAYATTVRRWVAEFDPEARHLVFGTDWIMLGIDAAYSGYTRRVHDFFRDRIGFDATRLERLFSGNATRLFGLRPGDAGHARLLDFYRRHGVPMSRFPVAVA